MNLLFKNRIRWGWLIYSCLGLLIPINAYFLFFLIRDLSKSSIIPLLLSFTPILLLNLIFSPVILSVFSHILKKENPQLLIFDKGIQIKKRFFEWDKIKSISLHNGRLSNDAPFYGVKQPALQKIYLLDKKGQEYSCIIDIDYFFKKNRINNNYFSVRNTLIENGKISMLSDWAEKR